MKCQELTDKLVMPKKVPGWDTLSIEEKYQRDINLRRVRRDIAPYFAHDPDRFTGALIVAVLNDTEMKFESVASLVPSLPELYKKAAERTGALILSGEEILVPLDGQHRAKAIQYAISGVDEAQKDIEGINPDTSLAKETLVVILVRFEPQKARRIFNKVNRYARPTQKSDNLITDDDDHVAVLTRWLVNQCFASRLINIRTTTLKHRAVEFTTLATLYECNRAILDHACHTIPKAGPIAPAARKLMEKELQDTWTSLLTDISAFAEAVKDPDESGDNARIELREDNILGTPVGQQALVRAFLRIGTTDTNGVRIRPKEACQRLDSLDWSKSNPQWQGVLMNGNKVSSGRAAVNLAVDFVAWCAGFPHGDEERDNLIRRVKDNLSDADATAFSLPSPWEPL